MQSAKLYSIISIPWSKFNEFFDKGCWGIWGLSPLLKYTLLYFAAFFIAPVFGWVNLSVDNSTVSTYLGVFIIGALIIAFIWLVYLPLLSTIILFKAFKKVKHSVGELNSALGKLPLEMTPKELYTQPHWAFVIYLLYLKDYLVDFIYWFTQPYSVSLMNNSRVKFPLSMKIRHNARAFEHQLAIMNVPLKFVDFEINQQNTIYKFETYEKVRSFRKVVNKLYKIFQKESTFYIREENGQVQIIAPHE